MHIFILTILGPTHGNFQISIEVLNTLLQLSLLRAAGILVSRLILAEFNRGSESHALVIAAVLELVHVNWTERLSRAIWTPQYSLGLRRGSHRRLFLSHF